MRSVVFVSACLLYVGQGRRRALVQVGNRSPENGLASLLLALNQPARVLDRSSTIGPSRTFGYGDLPVVMRESSDKGVSGYSQKQVELAADSKDPFRPVRVVIYATFGISGLAGVIIAATQLGSKSNALQDLAINLGVLIAGVGIFLFDRKVTADLDEKTRQELSNPYLAGNALREPPQKEDVDNANEEQKS
mmetsp:Transcript_113763/g.179010  ORF Transcript_113763/g.179010 Transcript_113763/m.179010 type:complete len:192 (-) Transcript_113763:71-646(-)|eukprot:CAMPEP_0169241192 /NCGR_PEP_ID=MMETSP1016-20121227/31874_1 /TAXON_ID=342587 /ORGANISM="Karlodinium micrum, Strain CCMP2283" /LENGTH=191 /DNA_ID=CAMNT_0009321297 /DNA_START=66 /DNA_END=641 /DNA_ORIENTATION=+